MARASIQYVVIAARGSSYVRRREVGLRFREVDVTARAGTERPRKKGPIGGCLGGFENRT